MHSHTKELVIYSILVSAQACALFAVALKRHARADDEFVWLDLVQVAIIISAD